jgi:hypothetical protein
MRRGWRLFASGFGLLAVVGGLAATAATLRDSSIKSPAVLIIMAVFLAGFGIYALAGATVERLVLYEDAVEFVGLIKGKRRVRRNEIVGLRMIPTQHGYKVLVLELAGGKKPVKQEWTYETDPVLDAWLAGTRNLEVEDRAKAEAELLRSPALGGNEAERARGLARARKVARVLRIVTLAICAWGWVYPRPYVPAIIALGVLPLVGLLALVVGPRLCAVDDGTRMSPRMAFFFAVIGPGLVLAMRSIRDVNVLDWKPLLLAALIGGLVIAVVIAMGERSDSKLVPRRKLLALVVLTPLVTCYPWGALSLGNALLDHERPEVFRVAVRNKSAKYLDLDPWGPVTERKTVEVGRRLHDDVSVGEVLCVGLFPGAIGAHWYVVRRCATGNNSRRP